MSDIKQTTVSKNGTKIVRKLSKKTPKKQYQEPDYWNIEIIFDVYNKYGRSWFNEMSDNCYYKTKIKEYSELLPCCLELHLLFRFYSSVFERESATYIIEYDKHKKMIIAYFKVLDKNYKNNKVLEFADVMKFNVLVYQLNNFISKSAESHFIALKNKLKFFRYELNNDIINSLKKNLKATFYDENTKDSNSYLFGALDTAVSLSYNLAVINTKLAQGTFCFKALGFVEQIPIIQALFGLIVNWSNEKGGASNFDPLINSLSIVGAVASVLSSPMSLFINYYSMLLSAMKPIIKNLMKVIQERNNQYYILLGYNPMITDKDKELFSYFEKVMNSDNSSDIEIPVDNVLNYFKKKRNDIDDILEKIFISRDEVYLKYIEIINEVEQAYGKKIFLNEFFEAPFEVYNKIPIETSIWGFFTNIDVDKFRSWVFSYRFWLWVIHYGDLPEPKNAGILN